MKKIFLLCTSLIVLIALTILVSCHKSSSGPSVTINGIADVNMTNDTTNVYLGLTVLGNQTPVTVSLSGLPSGVSTSPATLSGTPTFVGAFNFTSSNAAAGTYPITVTVKNGTSVLSTYKFNLNIMVTADCAGYLTGVYTGTSAYISGTYTATVTKQDNNTILVSNFQGTGDAVTASVNCSTDSLSLIHSTYTGSGAFTSNAITIKYTVDTAHLTVTLTR